MSQNAVQRLQKLENDIKTVISIYEVAKKSNVNEDTDEENEEKPSTPPAVQPCNVDKPKWGITEKCASAFEQFKKLAAFSPRLGSRPNTPQEKKNEALKKPSSAPSSSSTTTTLCESEYLWQRTSDMKWMDFPDTSSTLLTTSEILQNANEILGNNCTERVLKQDEKVTYDSVSENVLHQNKQEDTLKGQKKEPNGINLNARERLKKSKEKSPKVEKSNKVTAKNYITALIEKELAAKKASEIPCQIMQKKIPRLVKQRLENFERQNQDKNFNKPFQRRKWPPERKVDEAALKSSEGRNCKRGTCGDGFRLEQKKNGQNGHSLDNSLSTESLQKGARLSPMELFKIIEKSNEKLEKMQTSKELALDIAAQLKEKHEEMRKSQQNMMDKLQTLEKDNERLSVEIKDAKEKKMKLQLKMEGIRSYSKTKLLKQDLKSREILEENEQLKAKLEEMEKKYNEEYIEKLIQMDKTQKERLLDIKNELKTRETRAEEEIKKLISEKSKLEEKVGELHSSLHERASRVENLETKICELEDEVKKQKQQIKKKSERLEESHKELEAIRENCQMLEGQVKTLRTNIESFDEMQKNLTKGISERENQIKSSQSELEKLLEENANLRKEIEKEKDAVLIKNKIIEDQQETIKQLREKSEEAKNLMKKNQSLERLLDREREEKLELQEALECVKAKKEELKKKIKSLEADLLVAPEEVVKDLQKTQMVLHELENQVHIKQKEWEHHLQMLIKEKEQACSVAEFATKKLMQTTNKFQKQSEAHKKLHQILAENLAEKEKNLRETISRDNCMKINPLLADLRSEMKRTSRQCCSFHCFSGDDNPIPTEIDWQANKIFSTERIRPEESTYFF